MTITEERRQQLIADCKAEIGKLERWKKQWREQGHYSMAYIESLLERQQIALAALEGNHAAIVAAAEKLVRCKGRYHSEQNYRALAELFGVTVPDLEPLAGDANSSVVPDGWVLIPLTPSLEHLKSIACRYRHDFYLLNESQRDGAIAVARQMYEECSGEGFFTIPLPPQPGVDHG